MIGLFGKLICLFTIVVAAAFSSEEASGAVSATACPNVTVIDIHGSGAGPNDSSATGAFMTEKLRKLLPGKSLKFETVPFSAAGGYPALLGAALKLPAAYHNSVVRTKIWLRARLEKLAATCPKTKVILAGHSQGAHVAGDVYQERSWSQVVGVALFGDPNYNHADKSNRFGLNVKPRQRIRTKLDGALAAPRPRPAFSSIRVLSFCHQFDPVCQAPLSRFELARFGTTQHKNYTAFGEPEAAAQLFANSLSSDSQTPKWPTRGLQGPTRFMIYLGASFISPSWARCSKNYCIAGVDARVYFFDISDGIEQIAHVSVSTSPKVAFQKLNEYLKQIGRKELTAEEIKQLLQD